MMRKIVFVSANIGLPWGGSEYLWSGAAERLAQRGVRVRVSVKRWDKPVKDVEHLRDIGCQISYRRPIPRFPVRVLRKLPLWRGRNHIRAHLRRVAAGADLVVISQGWHFDGLPWLEAARSLGYRYCVICQGVSELWWPGDSEIERLAPAWENACGAFFVAEPNLDMTSRMFVTPLAHARVVRNPFKVSYDARPAWPSQASPELSMAFVSRLQIAGKGHDLLLEVLSLPHWRERDIRVSLFGDGPNEQSFRRMAENANLSKTIVFEGFSENIEQIWSAHHVLILPSRAEGMPLVLVEAMLCGRPAIITDVGGVHELIRDNINGFLVKAPTVELLDEAMNRAWENRHRLKEIGEQAAIDVRKLVPRDPVEDFVQQLLELANPATVKDRDEQVAQNLRRDPVL